MKKTTIIFLIAGLFVSSVLKAQTLQEGINHLYAGRIKNAQGVFESLLAQNPNNIDAIYWLGQTKLETDEIMNKRIAAARSVYDKGMQSTNGAPLIKVGMGHVDLLAGRKDEARQEFETALTMTRGKKGDDPTIETAIGRAITDAKDADYDYAVRLLEDAVAKEPKNTEALLQLGNAYRKKGKGEGGGQAFATYKKALEVNPNFAPASYRLAMLFESQKNWELVLQYLNEAITKDSKFTEAYYELFYYYFYRAKFDEAETYLQKFIDSKLPESDIQDQYLYAQLCWARKDFDCANAKSQAVIAAMGENTKPKVYRLLADANLQKGDYQTAKKYSDLFMLKKNPDDINANDYTTRAKILEQTGGTDDEIIDAFNMAAETDTVLSSKIETLKTLAKILKEKKARDKEAVVIQKIISLKPKPIINDYFDLAVAYYFTPNYPKSREAALKMEELYPDQVYGYEWALNNSRQIDTLRKDSIAVPDALKLFEFSEKDTAKYKKQYISAASFLAIYYANDAKDRDKAIEFLKKWQMVDVVNAENIQKNIDILEKAPASKPKSTGKVKVPSAEAKKPVTTKSKTSVSSGTTAKR